MHCWLMLCPYLALAQTDPIAVHVAPDGDDMQPGTGTAPVATIQRAQTLARERRGQARDGYRIIVHDGTYHLPGTLTFGPQDSGTEAAPTSLEAAPNARPRLVGGRLVTGWEPYQGDILRCDLTPIGLGGVAFRELYCNRERQILARYPNPSPDHPDTEGWLYVEAPAEEGSKRAFIAYEGDLRPWRDLSQAEVFEFHRQNYYNTVVGVESVDLTTRTMTLAGNTYGEFAGGGAERYFIQNLLEELDSPGEWYLDRANSMLYFQPPKPIDECLVEAPVLDFAIHIQPGAQWVRIEGQTIEVARRTGVHIEGATNCRVARNTVRHCGVGTQIGGWGPWENCCGIGVFGGSANGVTGNDISQVGGHGIKLTGGDSETLTPAGNYAENNHIHHTGLDWKQGCGVRLEGVGNRFSRNTVHDIPRMAAIFGGWDHTIELNHMYRLSTETCDTGAIYTGGRDGVTPWGCVIRHNYIHDVFGFGRRGTEWASPHYSWGIYLDDNASGVDVIGNIVVGTVRGGVHIHNGRDNLIRNNILIGAELQQVEFNGWFRGHSFLDSRIETWQRNWEQRRALPAWRKYTRLFAKPPGEWVQMSGNRVVRNILVAARPGSSIYGHRHLPLDLTEFDGNLIWLNGRPIDGALGSGHRQATGEEMCQDPGFEEGKPGEMPASWAWYARPSQRTLGRVSPEEPHSGRQCLEVVCAPPDDPEGRFPFAMLKTPSIPIEPGASYLLSAWARADREAIPVFLVAQSYRENQHHWATETSARIGLEWRRLELGITVPGPNRAAHIPTMTDLYIRIDVRSAEGTVWIDDVSLREAVAEKEWEVWRERGHDVHSEVGDPLFVDPEKRDYRLAPASPALKLGFQPIPVQRIGCYDDPLRASWPIDGTP